MAEVTHPVTSSRGRKTVAEGEVISLHAAVKAVVQEDIAMIGELTSITADLVRSYNHHWCINGLPELMLTSADFEWYGREGKL